MPSGQILKSNVLHGEPCSDNASALISSNKWFFFRDLFSLFIECSESGLCGASTFIFYLFSPLCWSWFVLILVFFPLCFITSWADLWYSNYFQCFENHLIHADLCLMKNLTLSYVTLPSIQISTPGGHQYSEETPPFPSLSFPPSSPPRYLHELELGRKEEVSLAKLFSLSWCHSGSLGMAGRKEVVHWEMYNNQYFEKCVCVLQP